MKYLSIIRKQGLTALKILVNILTFLKASGLFRSSLTSALEKPKYHFTDTFFPSVFHKAKERLLHALLNDAQ